MKLIIDIPEEIKHKVYAYGLSLCPSDKEQLINAIMNGRPQEQTAGHWIRISPAGIYECSECGQNVMTSDICAYKFCHGCGAKMVEPKESEDKEI